MLEGLTLPVVLPGVAGARLGLQRRFGLADLRLEDLRIVVQLRRIALADLGTQRAFLKCRAQLRQIRSVRNRRRSGVRRSALDHNHSIRRDRADGQQLIVIRRGVGFLHEEDVAGDETQPISRDRQGCIGGRISRAIIRDNTNRSQRLFPPTELGIVNAFAACL